MVSVDVKQHVYLLTYPVHTTPELCPKRYGGDLHIRGYMGTGGDLHIRGYMGTGGDLHIRGYMGTGGDLHIRGYMGTGGDLHIRGYMGTGGDLHIRGYMGTGGDRDPRRWGEREIIYLTEIPGGGGRGRLYTYHYTVTTRMTPLELRWAAMRAILMFH